MAKNKIHIVSFNVPDPPDSGSVIDVYYKLEALNQAGVDIILHCFEYNRPQQVQLQKLCAKVHYYPGKTGLFPQFSLLPSSVKSRNHPALLNNLLEIPAPILFEGLHCCYLLDHPKLKDRKKLVRTQSIDHRYYATLWRSESNTVKRFFLFSESVKLRLFERKLILADRLLTTSTTENEYFQNKFKTAVHAPAFHPFSKINSLTGRGDYLLFHGDLSVAENEKVVRFLVQRVFSEITVNFVVAGKNPSDELKKSIQYIPHVSLVANPTTAQMNSLIQNAHICVVPSFQPAGMKLKLLASLFGGRHCLTNSIMLEGTNLEPLCHLADTPVETIEAIEQLMNTPFGPDDISKRKQVLENVYCNESNARKILELL
ncbi:MAG: glycosyltransferase [Mangrovibacterium sp.]